MTCNSWITIEAERALYVDRGSDVILCDRLPSPVTLVVKLASPCERIAARSDETPLGGSAEGKSRAEGLAQ